MQVRSGTTSSLVEVSSSVGLEVCREAALALIAATIQIVEQPEPEREPEPESEVEVETAMAAAASEDAQTAPGLKDLSSSSSIAGVARVTVESVDVVCGWAMGSVRARFPSIPELRTFDETDDDS